MTAINGLSDLSINKLDSITNPRTCAKNYVKIVPRVWSLSRLHIYSPPLKGTLFRYLQDDLNDGEAKKILVKLVSETSCPVCFDTLCSPVHLCTHGHGVCGKCRDELDKCPLCTEPFSSNTSKNILLNSVLDLLPHKCRYDGCQVIVKSGDDHEKWCGYQPTACKMKVCEWTGFAKNIHDHMINDHKDNRNIGDKSLNLYYPKANSHLNRCDYIFAHEHFFWMIMNKSAGKAVITVDFIHVPNGKVKSSYKMMLLFLSSKQSQASCIFVTPENVLNKEDMSMAFVYSKIQSLANNKRNLYFTFYMDKD